jgi:FtsH-binding integral membrane protein
MTSTVAMPETAAASNPTSDWRPHAMTGMAYGAIIMGLFGCLWLVWGLAAMNVGTVAVIAAAIAFASSLWIPAAALLRNSSRAMKSSSPLTAEERRQQSRMGRMFGFIFGAEGLLIFVAVNILNNHHLGDYAISAIAAIVGLHFLPLARLYRRPMYNVVGIIMTVAALLSLAVPSSIRISVLASTMSAILWVTCVLVVRKGFAIGRELHATG